MSMKPFEMVISDMVDDCGERGISRTAIASAMGKPLSTFSREISPYDEGAKLGAADILPLMNACDSDAPLEWLADARGYRLTSKTAAPDGKNLNEEINQAWEAAGNFLTKARSGAACAIQMLGLRKKVAKEMEDVLSRVQDKDKGAE